MRAKSHQSEEASAPDYEEEADGNLSSPIPNFTKSPLIIPKKMTSKTSRKHNNNNNHRHSSALSSSSGLSKSDQTVMMMMGSRSSNPNPPKLHLSSSLTSLMAALPLSPSPVCSSPSGSFSSTSSALPCDRSCVSGEFYTPTHQRGASVFSSMSSRRQDHSPRCLSISTIYESAIDHGHRFESHGNARRSYTYSPPPKSWVTLAPPLDYESLTTTTTTASGHPAGTYPVLPSVPEEMATLREWRRAGGRRKAKQEVLAEEEEEETQHSTPVNRPKPYEEFLDEVQKHKRKAEISARKKAVYTHLLDQLRRKEAAIDNRELKQRSKQEFQLEKTEMKLEKKRAKALQKMHQKMAEINMEAERKKARERRSFLKKMDKISGQIQEKKSRSMLFFRTWSCCCIPGSEETP